MRSRLLLCFFLFLPLAFAVDARYVAVHTIADNATTFSNYTVTFYGAMAEEVSAEISRTSLPDFVKNLFPIKVLFFSMNESANVLALQAAGVYPNFARRYGSLYHLGKFFTDESCVRPTVSSIPAQAREYSISYSLPQNWTVASMPANVSKTSKSIAYNFTSWKSGNLLMQNLMLDIKTEVSLAEYCSELAKLDAVQQNLFVDPHFLMQTNAVDLAYVLILFFVLFLGFRYIVQKEVLE